MQKSIPLSVFIRPNTFSRNIFCAVFLERCFENLRSSLSRTYDKTIFAGEPVGNYPILGGRVNILEKTLSCLRLIVRRSLSLTEFLSQKSTARAERSALWRRIEAEFSLAPATFPFILLF